MLPIFRSSATSSGWRSTPPEFWLSRRLTIDRRAFEIMMRGFCAKADDVAISTMIMIATSVRTSIVTSSAGFPLGHPGRDKFNN
jgi:hypothetical protein